MPQSVRVTLERIRYRPNNPDEVLPCRRCVLASEGQPCDQASVRNKQRSNPLYCGSIYRWAFVDVVNSFLSEVATQGGIPLEVLTHKPSPAYLAAQRRLLQTSSLPTEAAK